MKLVLILVYSLFQLGSPSNNPIYWENLTAEERETVLSLEQMNPLVSDYYLGRFTATDDDLTVRLLDVLTTKQENNGVRALYFFLFNRILISADGALAEMLGDYAIKMVSEEPQYILPYLSRSKSLEECYVSSIGFELYLDQRNPSVENLSMDTLKSKILKKTSNNKLIQPFLKKIEEYISQVEE